MVKIDQVVARVDDLSIKERVLVLAAAGLVVVFLWHALLLQPLNDKQGLLSAELDNTRATISSLDAQSAIIVEQAGYDPDTSTRNNIDRTRQQISEMRKSFEAKTADLIAPQQMAEILQLVLQQFEGLSFLSIEGLGAEPLVDPDLDETSEPMPVDAYRHGMRLRFEGGYIEAINYLRALEALPYGFFWDSIRYQVKEFPTGESSVVVYTLSDKTDWIGA